MCSHNGQDNDHHFKEATEWLGPIKNLAIELFTNYSKNYDHFIYSLSLFAKKHSKLKVKSAAFQVTCATKQIAVHFVTRQISSQINFDLT